MKRILSNSPALITTGICLWLVLPQLVMDGMFMDAVMYSAVGRNLSEGLGSFWFPYFTEAHMATSTFHENPPLGYYLMSLFYRVFGGGIITERIYTGFVFTVNAILIVKFWRMLWPTNYKMAWLPVFLWVSVPIISWSFQNNMMENTMSMFVLGSSMASYRAIKADHRHLYWAAWAGFLAVLAFMIKGFPGLFIWVTPLAWAFFEKKSYGKAIAHLMTMIAVAGAAAFAIYMYEPSRQSMDVYLMERTATRLADGATTTNPFSILISALLFLIPPVAITALFAVLANKINKEPYPWYPAIGALILLGVAGTVPFSFTGVQRDFYLVPAFPFYALAMASLLRPMIEKTTSKWRRSAVLKTLGWVLIASAGVASAFTAGVEKRDKDILVDVRAVRDNLPRGTVAHTTADFNQNWKYKAYLVRSGIIHISDRPETKEAQYYILPTDQEAPEDYNLLSWSENLAGIRVYEKG